jgi:hypothetical protein
VFQGRKLSSEDAAALMRGAMEMASPAIGAAAAMVGGPMGMAMGAALHPEGVPGREPVEASWTTQGLGQMAQHIQSAIYERSAEKARVAREKKIADATGKSATHLEDMLGVIKKVEANTQEFSALSDEV